MQLYQYIFEYRTTIKKLSEQLGVNPNYLSKVSKYQARPSVELARKIEKATQGEVKWPEMFDNYDKKKPSQKSD